MKIIQTFVGRNVRTQYPNIFAGLHFSLSSNSNLGSLFYAVLRYKKFYRIGPRSCVLTFDGKRRKNAPKNYFDQWTACQDPPVRWCHQKNKKSFFFFNVGPLLEDIFLTTFYGLYFSSDVYTCYKFFHLGLWGQLPYYQTYANWVE